MIFWKSKYIEIFEIANLMKIGTEGILASLPPLFVVFGSDFLLNGFAASAVFGPRKQHRNNVGYPTQSTQKVWRGVLGALLFPFFFGFATSKTKNNNIEIINNFLNFQISINLPSFAWQEARRSERFVSASYTVLLRRIVRFSAWISVYLLRNWIWKYE